MTMGLGPNVNLFKRKPKNWDFEGGSIMGALYFKVLLTALDMSDKCNFSGKNIDMIRIILSMN